MVTPFDANGGVDEDAFVRLLGFLAENGSDGVVVAGTTGEGSTLTDDEKLRLFQLVAVKQSRYEKIEAIEGLDLLAGNDDTLAEVMDAGGTGGVLTCSPFVGRELRQIIDDPETRAAVQADLQEVIDAFSITQLSMTV